MQFCNQHFPSLHSKDSRSGLSPDTTHGNPEQTPNSKELFIGITESTSQFEYSNQEEITDEGPLPSESIGEDTKDKGSQGSEEESEGDGGSDCFGVFTERLAKSLG